MSLPDGSRRAALLHVIFWTALLSAFAAIGLPVIYRSVNSGYLLPPTKFSSTDAYLTKIRPNVAFSASLIDLFGSFPRERPVLVLFRDGDFEGTLLAQLMAYLAWPHAVKLITVMPHVLPPELTPTALAASGAAVVGCHVPLPPGSPPAVSLSSSIAIAVPNSAGR